MSGGRKPDSSRPRRRSRASSSGFSSRPKSVAWPTKHFEQNQDPQSSTPSAESSSLLQALQVRAVCLMAREYTRAAAIPPWKPAGSLLPPVRDRQVGRPLAVHFHRRREDLLIRSLDLARIPVLG